MITRTCRTTRAKRPRPLRTRISSTTACGRDKWALPSGRRRRAIFDNLSKSANFAACRRRPGDMAGLGS